MKIAMIGCGAAGSCFAGYLRKGGADITLVDRYQAHMDKVAKDGLEFIVYPDTHYHLDGFKTAYTADDIGIMDIVIFVTKATQLDSAVQSAMPCIGPDTVLVSLINGLGNDDILLSHFPANRILCGSGALGTQLKEPGCCVSTEVEGTLVHFGALENGPVTDKAGKHLAEVFTKGGCRIQRRRPSQHLEEGHHQLHRQHRLRAAAPEDLRGCPGSLRHGALPRCRARSLRHCHGKGRSL